MLKRLYTMIIALAAIAGANAAIGGEWKLHGVFDRELKNIVDTPEKVYYQVLMQPYNVKYPELSREYTNLFCYDKQANETYPLNRGNYLRSNLVQRIEYNGAKRYLVVVYEDSDIDLLFDDGHTVNIPAIKQASIPMSKKINDVVFDPEKNRIYLATDFGYVIVDDVKRQIVQSRIFNTVCNSVAEVDGTLIVMTPEKCYFTKTPEKALSLSDFKVSAKISGGNSIMPLDGGKWGYISPSKILFVARPSGSDYVNDGGITSNCTYKSANYNGYTIGSDSKLTAIDRKGVHTYINSIPDPNESLFASWDLKEYWRIKARRGLSSFKRSTEGKFSVTRADMMPNASNAFICEFLRYSPDYGMLLSNHGINHEFNNQNSPTTFLLSGLKDGEWTSYGVPYCDSALQYELYNPNGLAIDPVVKGKIYHGSFFHGLVCLDLEDGGKVSVYSHKEDKIGKLTDKFHVVMDTDPSWADYNNVSCPEFDANGMLWWARIYASSRSVTLDLYHWSAADRKANNTAGIKKRALELGSCGMSFKVMPLKTKGFQNVVVIHSGLDDLTIAFYDHGGTPDDKTDDKTTTFRSLMDQDGNSISSCFIRCIYEDTDNGLLWFCTTTGVFYINLSTYKQNPNRVTRVKVSRNDGTNLADYLLDNVRVQSMTADSQNRKWFATDGGGLVCTTPDGREILAQFTADNSLLPSNVLYGVGYNEANGSIMCSTSGGPAEFFIRSEGSGAGSDTKTARVYPNPVRPDYMGWVTIDNLPDDAIVKITDAAGNVIKELGQTSGGTAKWDVTGTDSRRVKSGVYYILSTSSSEGESNVVKGKVLVVS